MRVLISTVGDHEPAHHYVVVDGQGLLIDLTPLGGLGADPSVETITWGPTTMPGSGEIRDAGAVTRRGGVAQTTDLQRFYELGPIRTFIDAHAARLAELRAEQAAFDTAVAQAPAQVG